jgi:lipopolysaccharide transport system permease protein
MKKNKIQKSNFAKYFFQLQNYWKLGWLDNKARYSKTYLGEVWIAFSVILLSTMLGLVYGDIFGGTIQGDIKYFSYLALGITLWNCIADAMALGSRFIIESAPQILNTNFSLKSLFLRKFFYICQNLVIGLSSILFVILFVNKELIGNYFQLFLPLSVFLLFNLLIIIYFSLIGCLIRDFAEIVPLLTTIIFLGSPILYPASRLDNLAWIANVNIPYRILDIVRNSILTGEVNYLKCFFVLIFELILLLLTFSYLEKNRTKIALWCD